MEHGGFIQGTYMYRLIVPEQAQFKTKQIQVMDRMLLGLVNLHHKVLADSKWKDSLKGH